MGDGNNSGSQTISLVDVMREIRDDQKTDRETLNAIATDMKLFQHDQAAIRKEIAGFTAKMDEVGDLSAAHANMQMRLALLEDDLNERREMAKDIRKKIIDVFIGKVMTWVCMAILSYFVYIQGQKPPGP